VVRIRAAETLSNLQQQFYQAALSDLKARAIDVDQAGMRGGRLSDLTPELAAQILLLIQSSAHVWIKEGKVGTSRSHSVMSSAANLVGKLLALARPQLLLFE
jgi:hypothetical protein